MRFRQHARSEAIPKFGTGLGCEARQRCAIGSLMSPTPFSPPEAVPPPIREPTQLSAPRPRDERTPLRNSRKKRRSVTRREGGPVSGRFIRAVGGPRFLTAHSSTCCPASQVENSRAAGIITIRCAVPTPWPPPGRRRQRAALRHALCFIVRVFLVIKRCARAVFVFRVFFSARCQLGRQLTRGARRDVWVELVLVN